jgi:hypothetical protein
MDPTPHDDPERWALTWRAHLRKMRGGPQAQSGQGSDTALQPQSGGT